MSSRRDPFNKYLDYVQNASEEDDGTSLPRFNINWAKPEHMHVHALRIYTFVSWMGPPSATRLARAGFYFDAESGRIICFSCGGIFQNWKKELTIIDQHRLENRSCAFANGLDHRNIPLEPIDNVTTNRVQNKNETHNEENNSVVHKVAVSSPFTRRPNNTRDSRLGNSLDSAVSSSASSSRSRGDNLNFSLKETVTEEVDRHNSNTGHHHVVENVSNLYSASDRTTLRAPQRATQSRNSSRASADSTDNGNDSGCGSDSENNEKQRVKQMVSHIGHQLGNGRTGSALSSSPPPASSGRTSNQPEPQTANNRNNPRMAVLLGGNLRNQHRLETNALLRKHAPLVDPSSLGQVLSNPRIVEPDHPVLPRGVFGLEPRYPEYRDLQDRIDSYATWPTDREQTPKQMAAAGFFYAGITDCVRCFACNGGLRNWLPGDDPWCEHRRWFPECAFILTTENHLNYEQMQSGSSGASAEIVTLALENLQQNSLNPSLSSRSNAAESDITGATNHRCTTTSSSGSDVDQFMTSSIATIAMEMGFSTEIIREVAQNFYTRSGKLYTSSTDLLDDIFRHEDHILENSATVGASNPAPAVQPQEQRQATFTSESRSRPEPSDSDITPAKKPKKSGKGEKKQPQSTGGAHYDVLKSLTLPEVGDNGIGEVSADLESIRREVQAIKIDNLELKESRRCRVCWDQDICIVFLPCGHMCTCSDCAAALKDCPICRGYIRGTIKTQLL